jgi:hypothetical protein
MNLRTKSIYPFGGQFTTVDLFGYVSHGVPGIEIVGMGRQGRAIKEKFIYLTREYRLKMPKRRFVLCVDGELEGKKFKDEEYRFLELPLLLMFWSLSGHLPFATLDDCFSAGKVSINGEVECLELAQNIQQKLTELLELDEDKCLKVICNDHMEIIEDYYHISLEGVLKSLNLDGMGD